MEDAVGISLFSIDSQFNDMKLRQKNKDSILILLRKMDQAVNMQCYGFKGYNLFWVVYFL